VQQKQPQHSNFQNKPFLWCKNSVGEGHTMDAVISDKWRRRT